MTLWFQSRYVTPILDGTKTDTWRRLRCRLQAGDIVRASVGPRPAFATLRILSRDVLPLESCAHADDLRTLYPGEQQFVRLTFELLD